MAWHPLGPDPEENKPVCPSYRDDREGWDRYWAADKARREAEALEKDRATLSTEDVYNLLTEDLTPQMVRHRRLRAEYRVEMEGKTTRELLSRYERGRHYSYWGDDYHYDYPDILEDLLREREHVAKSPEARLLRRMNATKHHGPRKLRESVKADLRAYRSKSRRAQAALAENTKKLSEAYYERLYAALERCHRLGREVDPWIVRLAVRESVYGKPA